MREIKLKAFDKRTKCLVDIDGFRYLKGEKIKIFFTDEDGLDEQCVCDKRYIELIRSTGLHDKNGVEIYEGNIVCCTEAECMGRISWNESEAGFYFEVLLEGGQYEEEHMYDYIESMEVIGNILENSELLESEVPHE
ncbi:YopX family protein [Lachnospiraceae bacterium LCP25S3_G4]